MATLSFFAKVFHLAMRQGNLLHLSGHPPLRQDGTFIKGVVGRDLTVEEGKQAARAVGLAMLATIQAVRSRERQVLLLIVFLEKL